MALRASGLLTLCLIACGEDADLPNRGGQGGCAADACADGGAGGGAVAPMCHGVAIAWGEAELADEGRTALVSCDGYELRATALEAGVVRLRYVPEGEAPPERPSYAVVLSPDPDLDLTVGADDASVHMCTSELLVEIDRSACSVRVTDANGVVLSEDAPEGGFVRGGPLGDGARGLARRTPEDERFYGFGERTGALDKRGRTMTFWNTDAFVAEHGGYPPGADPLYQSIPFFTGLRGSVAYGVLLDDTFRLFFDMASSEPDRYELWAESGVLDEYILAGPSMADVVERYSRLTGKPARPPRWALGYHQSRWGYYPDAKLLEVAQELRSRSLPADGLWLDIQHMDGYRSFTWDPAGFPDPSGLVGDLADLGFKSIAIVDPAIKVDPAWDVYSTGLQAGRFLNDGDEPYVGEVWPGPAVFPDFSDAGVRAWWAGLIPRATDVGVRGLWIDMNEPSNFTGGTGTVPNDLACAGDGAPSTMAEMHNVYALNEARATYDGLRAAEPDRRPFVLSRAGYAGIQRYAAVWTGDTPSTWPTLAEQLPMLLGLGISGVPFVGSDVGGYSGGASPELFARWMQLGSFSPFFRGHVMSGAIDQEPWQFGTEVEDISRRAIDLRYQLLPTHYSLLDEAIRTGAPILRPMVYEFQDDPATYDIDDQAMLGPFLLIAPVLQEGATSRTVYLPEGRWFDMRSGAIWDGPATIDVFVTLGALPTFVREGGIVARGPRSQWSDERPLAPLELDLYPSASETSFTLYEDDGESLAYERGGYARTTFVTRRTLLGAELRTAVREGAYVPPERSIIVRVRRADHGLDGATLAGEPLPIFDSLAELVEAGAGAHYDEQDLSIVAIVPDQADLELELTYDPVVDDPRPPVPMTFRVEVPAGTPADPPIHWASSANGWTHQPLVWGPEAGQATGIFEVPRGEWVFYKYSRGDWPTVEKWPGCVEAENRYELGAAHPVKEDTVFTWADLCGG